MVYPYSRPITKKEVVVLVVGGAGVVAWWGWCLPRIIDLVFSLVFGTVFVDWMMFSQVVFPKRFRLLLV